MALTVNADHSVPVHYMEIGGNTADTDTHNHVGFPEENCGSPRFHLCSGQQAVHKREHASHNGAMEKI